MEEKPMLEKNWLTKKRSISVMEMGRMLGLRKTGSYWLVKKNYFETILVGGKMRVLVESFESWYNSQTHYKKVDVKGGRF
jgi:hypothetical protein